MKLIDYIKVNEGNVSEAEQLVQKFINGNPPSNLQYLKSEHCHPAYKDKSQQLEPKYMQAICDREREQTMRSERYFRHSSKLDPTEIKSLAMESAIVKYALSYAFYGIGNCSHRAAYAAIKLFELLKGTSIRVKFYSYVKRDQFVCYLIDKEDQMHVYDPYTNPEELYEPKFYRDNILTIAFEEIQAWNRNEKVDMWIRPCHFEQLLMAIKEHTEEAVNFGSLDVLNKDIILIFSLGGSLNQAVLKQALENLNKIRADKLAIKALSQSDSTLFAGTAAASSTSSEQLGAGYNP